MAKACQKCRKIFDGETCPVCGGKNTTDTIKGKVMIFNPQESQIAKHMKIHDKGEFAIKIS
ncbi:MAG: transcription elongation factor subunit Spt4 [Candidatus Nanoarchaeia archaeon]